MSEWHARDSADYCEKQGCEYFFIIKGKFLSVDSKQMATGSITNPHGPVKKENILFNKPHHSFDPKTDKKKYIGYKKKTWNEI